MTPSRFRPLVSRPARLKIPAGRSMPMTWQSWHTNVAHLRPAALVACALLAACASTPSEPTRAESPAAVRPVPPEPVAQATGGIYNGRQSDHWFGRGRSYQVGDVITVLLNESTQAARQQSANVSREASNEALPTGLSTKIGSLATALGGINLNGGNVASAGTGTADQRATLTGSIAATVVEVLPNGNLVVRGEKQLTLSEGSEVIQVSGVIRPEDVSRNNMVQSRRLANAQISYKGSGDLANASRPGWGTSLLMRFWPF